MTTASDLVNALESLRGLVRTHTTYSDRERHLHPEVAASLADHGLYRLWIPRTFGGFELDVPSACRVFEAASRIDGSAGWAVTIGTGGGVFAATLRPDTAREIFVRQDALIAGSGGVGGTAARVDGGYTVSGRWHYASGAHHATTITASTLLSGPNGEAIVDDAGNRIIRAVAFVPADVEILDTWDTIGMRGTGSHDFRATDVFVPESRTFSVFGEPYEQGPLYRYPFACIAAVSFASVALGIGAHLLEVFEHFAESKRLLSGGVLAETPAARIALAEATTAITAAREGFYAAVERSWELVVANGGLAPVEERLVSHASIHASRATVNASNALFELTGMGPLHAGSELGRCWRDLHTVSHHGVLSPLLLDH